MATFTVENKKTGVTMEVTEEQWANNQLFKTSTNWRIKKGGSKQKAERPVATGMLASPKPDKE